MLKRLRRGKGISIINSELIKWISNSELMKLNRMLIVLFAIVGMVPPMAFRAVDWYYGNPIGTPESFLLTILISMMTTVAVSCGVVTVMIWLHKSFPWNTGVVRRLALEVILTTLTACGLILAITLLTEPFKPHDDLSSAIFNNVMVAIILNVVLVGMTEGIFFFKEWKQSTIEAERFKKESILAQFQSLKNQVNPHFLFNSLNTLSSLIDYDKELSKEFVDDLSIVYRYVLQNRDEDVVSLQTELEFIQSFMQLLKKRHGNRVSFQVAVSEENLTKYLPPMTLQILIENAVKHNVASQKRPLWVEISSEADTVLVRNNLQRKKGVESTGVGLVNTRNRYAFLTDKEIEIREDRNVFEVKVPLLHISDIHAS